MAYTKERCIKAIQRFVKEKGTISASSVRKSQLAKASYLFLRAYKDKDFTKQPMYKWRIPVELLAGRKTITIFKDENIGWYNVKNMKEYEV